MTVVDLQAAVIAALTAKGSGALSFEQMMDLIEAGRCRGLAVSTVDATCDRGRTPRPDLGFHVESDDLDRMANDISKRADATAERVRETYKAMVIDDGVEFEVWFWRD